MKYPRLISSITMLILAALCTAQVPVDFPVIPDGEIEGAEIIRTRTFSGSALYGYMNGGAELYHEYGFNDAVITELNTGTGKYKVEVFRMNSPESAYGIFSVSRYKCIDAPSFWKYTCRARYQLQICKGRYYISIINSNGNRSDSIASVKIGKLIAEEIADSDFDLNVYLPETESNIPQLNNVFLAKGRLGIVNGTPDLEDYFRGVENYTLVVLNGTDKKILSVRFSDAESLKKFTGLHNWNGLTITPAGIKVPSGEIVRRLSENHLYIEVLL